MLSSRNALALATMLAIALHGTAGKPVGMTTLIDQYGLKGRALEPVLQRLSRLGLIQSQRGAHGGYYLADADGLTLERAVRTLEAESLPEQPLEALQPLLELPFAQAREAWMAQLGSWSFAALAREAERAGLVSAGEPVMDFSI